LDLLIRGTSLDMFFKVVPKYAFRINDERKKNKPSVEK
jgi:hypothetical protein